MAIPFGDANLNTLLGEPMDLEESNLPTDLDQMLLPARPLADGTDGDSSNTSWEKLAGSGSGSVQYHGVGEEAGGNLTSGPSHTGADATAADIPPTAQGPLTHITHPWAITKRNSE